MTWPSTYPLGTSEVVGINGESDLEDIKLAESESRKGERRMTIVFTRLLSSWARDAVRGLIKRTI
jgi:hypothetical protein